MASGDSAPPDGARVVRRLRAVRWIAAVDLVLLVALVAASRMGQRDLVHVLGPLHGVNFLILLVTAATGALDRLWSWWFPAGVFLTGGPVGAFVGEWLIGRRAAGAPGGRR